MAVDPSEGTTGPDRTDVVPAQSAAAVRQKWTLTQTAFDRLLAALGPDRDHAAARYLEIRRNLAGLFEWRGCPTPDEYADEAINRCARKIADGEEIRDVPTYCIGIARMMLREVARDRATEAWPLDKVPDLRAPSSEPESGLEQHVECLRRCLGQLSSDARNLILHYYQGDKGDKIKNRKGLTELLGLSPSTLRMRALRVRERLQLCVENCMQKQGRSR